MVWTKRCLAVLACWPLMAATVPSRETLLAWHQREDRVGAITRSLLVANARQCADHKKDYGLIAVSPNAAAPPTIRQAYADAFHLGDGSTIITILPDSPAARAGLQVGDAIMAVNDIAWDATPEQKARFATALAMAQQDDRLALIRRRDGADAAITLQADALCDAYVVLTNSDKVNAQASGKTIAVAAAMEALLPQDDALAFVIAHELAHIILGHSASDQRAATKDHDKRFAMEKDADALGLRLMTRAGYDPDRAAEAHGRIAEASRGPISRLLDLHGPYMSTPDRLAFLREQAPRAKAEIAAERGRP